MGRQPRILLRHAAISKAGALLRTLYYYALGFQGSCRTMSLFRFICRRAATSAAKGLFSATCSFRYRYSFKYRAYAPFLQTRAAPTFSVTYAELFTAFCILVARYHATASSPAVRQRRHDDDAPCEARSHAWLEAMDKPSILRDARRRIYHFEKRREIECAFLRRSFAPYFRNSPRLMSSESDAQAGAALRRASGRAVQDRRIDADARSHSLRSYCREENYAPSIYQQREKIRLTTAHIGARRAAKITSPPLRRRCLLVFARVSA